MSDPFNLIEKSKESLKSMLNDIIWNNAETPNDEQYTKLKNVKGTDYPGWIRKRKY